MQPIVGRPGVSSGSCKAVSKLVGEAMIAIFLLITLSVTAASSAPSSSSSIVYVDLFAGIDGNTCGSSESNACASVPHALSLAATDAPVWAYLVSSQTASTGGEGSRSRLLEPGLISDRDNITIDGSRLGRMKLLVNATHATNGSLELGAQWLAFLNCSNIGLHYLDLDLSNYSGQAVFMFQGTHDVQITNCILTSSPLHVTPFSSLDSWPFLMASTTVHGDVVRKLLPDSDYNDRISASALVFETGCDALWCSAQEGASVLPPCCDGRPARLKTGTSLLVTDCTFKLLGARPRYALYFVPQPERGIVLEILVGNCSGPVSIDVINSVFEHNQSPFGTTVKTALGSGMENAQVRFTGCTFQNNWAYVGGGLMLHVLDDNVLDKQLFTVLNSTFTNNTAVLEGGAIRGIFVITNSSSEVMVVDHCSFSGNVGGTYLSAALVGGALSISSSPLTVVGSTSTILIPALQLRNSQFHGNAANFGAAVFLKRFNAFLNNITMEDQLGGSTVWASMSTISLSGRQHYRGGQDALYGGVFALYDFSKLIMEEDIQARFENNAADIGGGVLYADLTSSSPDIQESILFITDSPHSKQCFLGTEGVGRFNYSSFSAGGKVYFHNNTAKLGSSVYANSFAPCTGSPMLPGLDNSLKKAVRYTTDVASGAVWMFFGTATCPCLKPVLNSVTAHWHFIRSCSRESVREQILAANESYQFGEIDEFINTSRLFKQQTAGVGVRPDSQYFFLTPWTTSTWQWYFPLSDFDLPNLKLRNTSSNANSFGNLTLYPAPGQVFQLEIELADFYFNLIPGPCTLKVTDGDALIQHEGYQYGRRDGVYFGSLNAVAIALVGVPGTYGSITLQTQSQIRSNSVMKLVIPFRLSPCHLGFQTTDMMRSPMQARNYTHSAITQPLDDSTNALSCACLDDLGGVVRCDRGAEVILKWEYWGGSLPNGTYIPAEQPSVSRIDDLGVYEAKKAALTFVTGLCLDKFCDSHERTAWSLQNQTACSAKSKRTGLLCGECVSDHYLTGYYSQPCSKCSPGESLLNTAMFCCGVFLYIGIAIALMSFFDVGRSSNFESWVCYDQMCAFLMQRQAAMVTFTTFSLPVCLRWLTAGLQVAIIYITPLYTLLWVFLIFQLSRLRWFRRTFHTYSVIPTMWAAISFAYGSAVFPSLLLLSCHSFNGEYVFFADARMTCGGLEHLPYLIMAILVICVVCFSFPIVLYVKHDSPRIKPLFDVYLSYVKDERKWWIFYSLIRRVAVAIISAMIDNQSTLRQVILAVLTVVFFLVHYFVQPYKKQSSNNVECLFLANNIVFAIINIPSPTDLPEIYIFLLWADFLLPTVLYFLYGVYIRRKTIREHLPCLQWGWTRAGRSYSPNADADDGEDTPLTTSEKSRLKKWTVQVQPGEVRDPLLLAENS